MTSMHLLVFLAAFTFIYSPVLAASHTVSLGNPSVSITFDPDDPNDPYRSTLANLKDEGFGRAPASREHIDLLVENLISADRDPQVLRLFSNAFDIVDRLKDAYGLENIAFDEDGRPVFDRSISENDEVDESAIAKFTDVIAGGLKAKYASMIAQFKILTEFEVSRRAIQQSDGNGVVVLTEMFRILKVLLSQASAIPYMTELVNYLDYLEGKVSETLAETIYQSTGFPLTLDFISPGHTFYSHSV